MSARHTLLLRLCGPMQSWGHRSRFDDRDTALEPTRSGVIGLICAAMGLSRDQDLARFDALRMGVRVDSPGRPMVDYHTALDVVKADGSRPPKGEAVQSWRHYLADACFLVALECEDLDMLREIEDRLACPVWPLYLGRKSFPLTIPPLLPEGSLREESSLEEALASASILLLDTRLDKWIRTPDRRLRTLIEPRRTQQGIPGESAEGEISQSDRPMNFGKRQFALRRVQSGNVPVEPIPALTLEDHR